MSWFLRDLNRQLPGPKIMIWDRLSVHRGADVRAYLNAASHWDVELLPAYAPEFIAQAVRRFLASSGVETLYVEPGSPWQNGYAESFHSRLRSELLDAEVFETVAEAQSLSAAWKNDYNHRRPHSSLGYQTPAAFATGCAASAPAAPALQQHTRKEELETVPLTLPHPVLS